MLEVRFEAGPEVFRQAALDAAHRLSFAPATRDGRPVPATTRVRFHFAPPVDAVPLIEITVHTTDPDLADTRARTTLDAAALERAAGDDLAETVAAVPGVRLAGGTSDAAKPIIRGQHERRLLVLYDGVRHESQKWGPDHATEIDPFAAGTISVIRGAAGARYGPDALGGVILVEPPRGTPWSEPPQRPPSARTRRCASGPRSATSWTRRTASTPACSATTPTNPGARSGCGSASTSERLEIP